MPSRKTIQSIVMDVKKPLERDWSSIPPELLHCIGRSIREISDFIRFRIVCSTWRSSIQITEFPSQFPWIFERRINLDVDLTFYSIPLRKTYSIRMAKAYDKFLYGPSEGYLFTRLFEYNIRGNSSPRCSLLNPLNNQEIFLPSYTHRYCLPYDCKCLWIGPRQTKMGEYIAFRCDQGLPIYYMDQKIWRKFRSVSHKPCSYFFLKGMIFGVEKLNGITTVIDINNLRDYAYIIPPVEGHMPCGNVYIVEAYGDILRVFTHPNPTYSLDCQFDVHRLDVSENNSACWVKINNIGDQAIFIDAFGGFVIKANEIAHVKRNCIYILKRIQNKTYGVIRINIETRTEEVFQCPFKDPLCWFMPNLQNIHTK